MRAPSVPTDLGTGLLFTFTTPEIEIMKTAIEYLGEYNIPWRRHELTSPEQPTWDGSVLTLDWGEKVDSLPSSVEWVFHEISHHLFCPSASLKLSNYGLGTDPAGGGWSSRVRGSERGRNADEDESAVCTLDVVLMHEHEMSETFIKHHISNYNIDTPSERGYELLKQIGVSRERIDQTLFYYS
jgi:hypothetical protein